MATISMRGLDEYIAKIEQLTVHSRGICKMSLWEGGKVVGDNIRSALNNIPEQDHYVPKGTMRKGLTKEQKSGVISGFGLAKMRQDGGSISTKAGFHGSTDGKRNSALMRGVESGTSYMEKHPIVRPAINKSRSAAVSAIEAKFSEVIQNIMN